MIPFQAYKVIHLFAVFMVVSGLTGIAAVYSTGAGREHPMRRLSAATHGIGLFLAILAGFGMIARGGYAMTQPWIIAKLVIWLALGGMIALARRKADRAGLIWLVTFVLAGVAAYLGIYKPGA